MDLLLDINVELYPVGENDRLTLALAKTLDLTGQADSGVYDPLLGTPAKPSLMDKYEYVMHGKVFKYDLESSQDMTVLRSASTSLRARSSSPCLQSSIVPRMRVQVCVCLVRRSVDEAHWPRSKLVAH